MIEKIQATTKKLNEIKYTAKEIVEKNAEVEGILKVIDLALEGFESNFEDGSAWALRAAIRSLESSTKDAAFIINTIEQFEEIK